MAARSPDLVKFRLVTRYGGQVRHGNSHRLQFTLFVQIPDILAPIRNFVTHHFSDRFPHVVVASRKHDKIGIQLGTIIQKKAILIKAGYAFRAVFELNLTVND